MLHMELQNLEILPSGKGESLEPEGWRARLRRATYGVVLGAGFATGLSGCSHPPRAAVALPPQPVGHPYQVMVDVPPPVSRRVYLTAEEHRQVQQAFNIIALKSALMVAALTCGQENQYDQFMTAFQPHVLADQHVMDNYFRRIGGYGGRAKEDQFITLLANNQSVNGINQGSMFCLNNIAEYKAVLALKTNDDLDNFVTDLPPGAATLADAHPAVTPLAPGVPGEQVAVVPAVHPVHRVKTHAVSAKSEHVAKSSKAHEEAATGVKPVAVAAAQ